MAYRATVVKDSISPGGARIITVEATYPRTVLAELNTHRQFSRNTQSSRAMTIESMIKQVLEDPFMPIWSKNQKGMQGDVGGLTEEQLHDADTVWFEARDDMVGYVKRLMAIGVAKQDANRLLEPFQFTTTVITSTTWANFLAQRTDKGAYPPFQKIAKMIRSALRNSEPELVQPGDWHLPYIDEDDWQSDDLPDYVRDEETLRAVMIQTSVSRCAGISYLRQNRKDILADLARYDKLTGANPMHSSPLEHAARACADPTEHCGNLTGWKPLRKMILGETATEYTWEGWTIK